MGDWYNFPTFYVLGKLVHLGLSGSADQIDTTLKTKTWTCAAENCCTSIQTSSCAIETLKVSPEELFPLPLSHHPQMGCTWKNKLGPKGPLDFWLQRQSHHTSIASHQISGTDTIGTLSIHVLISVCPKEYVALYPGSADSSLPTG